MRWCPKLFVIVCCAACSGEKETPTRALVVDPGASPRVEVREAVAFVRPTAGNKTEGVVRFRETKEGSLDVVTEVRGLPEGSHAYHVHVYGDCSSADARSAGPHFHFNGSSLDTSVTIVTGNLGDLASDGASAVTHRTQLPAATLQGPFSIVGRAVVVHAKPNDHAHPPDGDAGDRLACGVIGIAGAAPDVKP
jgi:Cu-Zn family superoxide dismutase